MNRVFINSAHIIEIHVVGDQTGDSVTAMCLDASDLIATLRDQNRQVFIIDNLKAMGETTSDARKAVANYAKKLPFDRAAMVGDGTAIMRFSTNLMLRAIGRSNIRYFSSVDGAMIWFGLDPAEVRV